MPGLDLTFLGTGTSLGIPVIGCRCSVCTSSDPRDRRSRASVYVRTLECAFVIDTGPDFRTQCLREDISEVDAVVYTHSHTDHIMGFDDLRPFCFLHPSGTVPIYAPPETMRDFERVFRFAFDGMHRFAGYLIPEPHVVESPFQLGGTTLTPLPVPHGKMTVTGYLLSRDDRPLFAYLSDCNGVPGAVRELIRGVDTLVIDALRHAPHPTHLNVAEALDISADLAPRDTLLTHLSHDLGHAETEASLPRGVRIAYDGLKLSL